MTFSGYPICLSKALLNPNPTPPDFHDRVQIMTTYRAPARKAQSSGVLPLVAKDMGALPQTMSAQGVMPQQVPRTGFSKSSLRLRLE